VGAALALARTDLRALRRDTLLLPLLVVVPALVVAVRFALPAVRGLVVDASGVDIATHAAWGASALFAVQLPFMLGGLVGLIVLDERDDGTLSALAVTPLGLAGYTRYRLATACALALALLLGGVPASGLLDGSTMLRAAPAIVPALLLVPLAALAMLVAAGNKVEGLAVLKGLGFVLLLPLVDYFVDAPWTPFLALVPSWWPSRAVWAAAVGTPVWPWALGGTVYGVALLVALGRRARRRVVAV
jgi:fluoroquinolone transport system permease protein